MYYVNRFIQGSFPNYIFLWLASTSFLAIGFILSRLQPSKYALFILLALFFCWLGDILGPFSFMLGGTAFLIGHVLYLISFIQLGMRPSYKYYIIAWLIPSNLFLLFLNDIAHIDILNFAIYLVVLSLMVAGSFALRPGTPRNLIRLAATLFFISDLALLSWNAGIGNFSWLCYPLYYISCILFAWSPLFLFPVIENK